jgi:hypothetical protein
MPKSMNETPATRVEAKAPSFIASSLRIFELSMGEMLWSRRTIFMALVVGAPVIIALVLRVLVRRSSAS